MNSTSESTHNHGHRIDWETWRPSVLESLEGELRTLASSARAVTEKTRKQILTGLVREHQPSRSLARCGTIVRRGAPSDQQAVVRSTCRAPGCPACGGWLAQQRAAETLARVPEDSTVVMVTLTSDDRREATLLERWSEQDLLWKSAFTNTKWLTRNAGAGAGWRRFPCLTYNIDAWGENRFLPHPHHHVVVALPGSDRKGAAQIARNMIRRYERTSWDLGIYASIAGQDYLVADNPRRVIRYASKAMGFVIGHPSEDHEGGVTMAELGLIAATSGDQDAEDRYIEALTYRTRLMAPGGVLRAG